MNDKIFFNYLNSKIPRIFSQFDRDCDSPTYGCFDRNFWHYKIRDFSSAILTQGALIFDFLYNYNNDKNQYYKKEIMREWTRAAMIYWAKSQLQDGSFNEYYPYESGFPPTAFSLYAIGLLLRNNDYIENNPLIIKAIQKSCNWLLSHPEKQAINQESAALSALALVSKIRGVVVNETKYNERLNVFFQSQTQEGWFPEYNGPDTGYLAVTIDCLWDYYDSTKDKRAINAINKAIDYIFLLISENGNMPVMINSRNTDYIVPYGIIRSVDVNSKAFSIIHALFKNIDSGDFFLNRTDDRYWCHYIGQSCFRSLNYLKKITDFPKMQYNDEQHVFLKKAGIVILKKSGINIFVNLRKGGIIYVFRHKNLQTDYGWRISNKKDETAITHWLNNTYEIAYNQTNEAVYATVKGVITKHKWLRPSPIKHLGLRLTSFFFGNKLIKHLKNLLIFKQNFSPIHFSREIIINDSEIIINDKLETTDKNVYHVKSAPHYSLRHVASAGLFVPEELVKPKCETYQVSKNNIFEYKQNIKLL